jgi:hypothetical protein
VKVEWLKGQNKVHTKEAQKQQLGLQKFIEKN